MQNQCSTVNVVLAQQAGLPQPSTKSPLDQLVMDSSRAVAYLEKTLAALGNMPALRLEAMTALIEARKVNNVAVAAKRSH